MKRGGLLPAKLFWYKDKQFETITNIGRGKEAYLSVLFRVDASDQVIVGKTMLYAIQTDGVTLLEPFDKGWLYIRISSQVNNKPLPFKRIKVRVEIMDGNVILKEIVNDNEQNHKIESAFTNIKTTFRRFVLEKQLSAARKKVNKPPARKHK